MNTYSFKPEKACVALGLEQPQGWNRGGFSTGDLSSQIPVMVCVLQLHRHRTGGTHAILSCDRWTTEARGTHCKAI